MSSVEGIGSAVLADHIEYDNAGARETTPDVGSDSGIDFGAVIAEAAREEVARASIMAGAGTAGMQGSYLASQMQTQGIEQMILAAASSGEINDAQTALFMLCMMMQGNEGGDFSMLMQMMASMINQMQGDSGTLRSSVMSSGFNPYTLDMIDWNIFGMGYPGYMGSGGVVLPLEFWRPTTVTTRSNEGNRSPELYRAVIGQFRVESAERYRPFRDGNTYCNIYVWDVTTAMGAELPLYTDPGTGVPRVYPDVRGAESMTAAKMDRWLKTHGGTYGWRQVDAETAQQMANEGKPVVASGGNLDHISIVCPSRDGSYDPVRGVTIAQAGRIVTSYTHISSIYGANSLNTQVTYWVHD